MGTTVEGFAGYPRDYLMPLPSVGLGGVVECTADVSDIMAIERTVLEALRAPAFIRKASGVTWSCSPKTLLPAGVGDYWTTHSARKVLPCLPELCNPYLLGRSSSSAAGTAAELPITPSPRQILCVAFKILCHPHCANLDRGIVNVSS